MKALTILYLVLLTSCLTPKIYPIKGTYSTGNFEAYSDKSKEAVWDNIIEFFAKNGISIRIIDRSSGLIISGETILTYSIEKENGELENKEAQTVIYRVVDPNTRKPVRPYRVTGEWNIRIKEQEGKTLINVNLVNASFLLNALSTTKMPFARDHIQSTGKFEKAIYDLIK